MNRNPKHGGKMTIVSFNFTSLVAEKKDNIKGKKVTLIVSGGNITLEQLRSVLLTDGGSSASPGESCWQVVEKPIRPSP